MPLLYRFNKVLEDHGHNVLRLPPYHPELNPIENIWATAKNWVAKHNTTFNLNDVADLARKKFDAMGEADWKPICRRVADLEVKMLEREHLFDDNECLRFVVNTGSSEDESTDSDSSGDI